MKLGIFKFLYSLSCLIFLCLLVLSSHLSIFHLYHNICSMFPKSTHETFSNKLFQNFRSHRRLEKAKFSETDFTISHYAGKVFVLCKMYPLLTSSYSLLYINTHCLFAFFFVSLHQVNYQTETFIDKNRDYVVVEHCNLLASSRCPFIAGLFPPLPEESSRSSYKFSSVASRFKVPNLFT